MRKQRLHGPMDKALVYGTRDSGFDPQWSRFLFGFFFSNFLKLSNCLGTNSSGSPNRMEENLKQTLIPNWKNKYSNSEESVRPSVRPSLQSVIRLPVAMYRRR